jgi:hypothetical protein
MEEGIKNFTVKLEGMYAMNKFYPLTYYGRIIHNIYTIR